MSRQALSIAIILFIMVGGWNSYALQAFQVIAYVPSEGHFTTYDYGFINVLYNQSAVQINQWTELVLDPGNYTMHWHQHVNLSILVMQLIPNGAVFQAYYNFSVIVFSNVVTVSNSSSWQTIVSLNGSVPAPAPTGVSSGLVDYPMTQGLPGFFLDDTTLSTITPGLNVIVGGSSWQSITHTAFTLGDDEQLCYRFFNQSSSQDQDTETTYVIDHDVGIYYQANETRITTVGSSIVYLSYYYQVLTTNISLIPPPSPLPIYIAAAIATIVLVIVVTLIVRALWLRRKLRGSLTTASESTYSELRSMDISL
ncbi:MAG: hypothetical protein ACFE9D_01050 [Promethearchaeota archaeon]